MEALQIAPETSAFIPLSEHQSRTPSSFHTGPAILHYHSQKCKIVILERDLVATPTLNALRGESAATGGESDTDEEKEIAIENVDTWVTSDKFLLYSPTHSAGLSIPYPSISLHAIQRLRLPGTESEVQGLYMQIATPDAPAEDDEEQCITLTVVPPTEPATESAAQDAGEAETPTQALYGAVSACSNLHPDPADSDDEDAGKFFGEDGIMAGNADGGLPEPVDGSSGWITAENIGDFMDENGNYIGPGSGMEIEGYDEDEEPLGPGAGTVHARENGVEQGEDESDETKWRRTD
ncbi:hypothetical protein N7492_000148 [Penicillium capsulatum]|uniref:Regulator of volume decrease after cellular swelling-domain-containing protein n=1 Tax=Penicillium capsulatum TaxID=69766 RepID=A0A9W9IRA8_9EURO|nr:hypothetical protein N7492_000148 [Penicillium capsulatum]KAJ6130787.1 hypothetical protein N7512_003567 [Penicillium capsulatum]